MKLGIKLLFAVALFLLSNTLFGQTKKELQKERKSLQAEIQQTNKLLSQTRSQKKNSLQELEALNQKIGARKNLINTINKEIKFIDNSIAENNATIAKREKELTVLKENYANLILQAYKSKSTYSRIMFLFSSRDFNQAYRRFRYMQEYGGYRREQAEDIITKQEKIIGLIVRLEEEKLEKEALLGAKRKENQGLASEQNDQRQLVQNLESKESELKKNLRKKEKATRQLQKAIETIIEAELKKARESSGSKESFTLTPEAKALSNSFASNKGNLPWPVERGIITGKFGIQPHPVLKGIVIENKGVLISTETGTAARAVYKGTIQNVLVIPGNHKAIMINHGEYYTVYSNLDEIYVTQGEKVDTKQLLGKIHTNVESGAAVLNFQLWKFSNRQNPSSWLYK
ncbi:MAG: septal ring factor EnvC (AmiA/AmiB activator) [Flavobacteriales bacterium]|jgi:septal ring factor EnvC (AmiA/AmiB activator)